MFLCSGRMNRGKRRNKEEEEEVEGEEEEEEKKVEEPGRRIFVNSVVIVETARPIAVAQDTWWENV